MIAFSTPNRHISIDNVHDPIIMYPTHKFEKDVVELNDAPLFQSAEEFLNWVEANYVVSSFVIAKNEVGGDILLSRPGLSLGAFLIVSENFLGMFYTSSLDKCRAIRLNGAVMKTSFYTLSPLNYRSTITAKFIGSNPESYYIMPGGSLESYGVVSTGSLPDAEYLYLEGMKVKAIFGFETCGLGVTFPCLNNKAAVKSIFNHRKQQRTTSHIDNGIIIGSNSSRTDDLRNFRSGLKIHPENWCLEYSRQVSEAYTSDVMLGFLCVAGSTTEIDSIIFFSDGVDGDGIMEWVNDGMLGPTAFVYSSSKLLLDILSEYKSRYEEYLHEGDLVGSKQIQEVINRYRRLQRSITSKLLAKEVKLGDFVNDPGLTTLFQDTKMVCDGSLVPQIEVKDADYSKTFLQNAENLKPIASIVSVSSENTVLHTSYGDVNIDCPSVALDETKYEKLMKDYLPALLSKFVNEYITPIAAFKTGMFKQEVKIDPPIDNAMKYYYNHGCGSKCNGIYSVFGNYDWYNAGTSGEYDPNDGRWAPIKSLEDYWSLWRVAYNKEDKCWVYGGYSDDYFAFDRVMLQDIKSNPAGLSGVLRVSFTTQLMGAHFCGANKNTLLSSLRNVMRSYFKQLHPTANINVSLCAQPKFLDYIGPSKVWDAAQCSRMENRLKTTNWTGESFFQVDDLQKFEVVFEFNMTDLPDTGLSASEDLSRIADETQVAATAVKKGAASLATQWLLNQLQSLGLENFRIVGSIDSGKAFLDLITMMRISNLRLNAETVDALISGYEALLEATTPSGTKVISADSPIYSNILNMLSELKAFKQGEYELDLPWFISNLISQEGVYRPDLLDTYWRYS